MRGAWWIGLMGAAAAAPAWAGDAPAPAWCRANEPTGCLTQVHLRVQEARKLFRSADASAKAKLDTWTAEISDHADFEGWLDDLGSSAGVLDARSDFGGIAALADQVDDVLGRVLAATGDGVELGWCRPLPGDALAKTGELEAHPDHYVVCIDARDGLIPAGSPVGQWPSPLPHQDVVVRVLHKAGEQLDVKVDGQRGFYLPETVTFNSSTPEPGGDDNKVESFNLTEAGQNEAQDKVTDYHFGQFLPGEITLKVQRPKKVSTEIVSAWLKVEGAWADAPRKSVVADVVKAAQAAADEADKAVKAASTPTQAQKDDLESKKKALASAKDAQADVEEALGGVAESYDLLKAKMALLRDERFPVFPGDGGFAELLGSLQLALEEIDALVDAAEKDPATLKDVEAKAERASLVVRGLLEILNLAPTGDVLLTKPLQVERTFMGVVRVGAAVVTAGATNGNYDLAPLGDGRSAITSNSSAAEFELVLGYSQMFHRRPRSAAGFRIAPTAALGLASVQLDADVKLTALRSLYLGFEIGWDKFAIAPTLALRQVDRLEQQYQLGMAVAPGMDAKDLVAPRFGVGFGIIVYAPEIARVRY